MSYADVKINGVKVIFPDQRPIIVQDRTLVPIRGVFENLGLGFTVDWTPGTGSNPKGTAALKNDTFTVIIKEGASTFTVNGVSKNLDVPAQIIGGRTMVPFRAILESVGCWVGWDDAKVSGDINGTVIVSTPFYVVTADPTLRVRETPSTDSAILHTFNFNQIIKIVLPKETIHDGTRSWIKVYYNTNEVGWVAEEYVKLHVISQQGGADENLLSNIERDASLGLSVLKKNTITGMGRAMLSEGYEASFVAGMLANIIHEGTAGMFESSAYGNPSNKPDYLAYMDEYYEYRNKYSGRSIYDQYANNNMNLSSIYGMLLNCEPNSWRAPAPDGRRRGFGLGSVQWTFDRTKTLVEVYREVADTSDTITFEQVLRAEGLMISREFSSSYRSVYSAWLSSNSSSINSSDAAYNAGYTICVNYEVPNDRYNKGVTRGGTARNLYNVMMGR